MAHLGRRPRASGSVIDLSQLPSPSPSGSYHLNHSDSTLSIRMQKGVGRISTQRPHNNKYPICSVFDYRLLRLSVAHKL